MIPLRDNIPTSRPPIINYAIIIVNCLFFILELAAGPHLQALITTFGFIPARYFVLQEVHPERLLAIYLPVFTTMFLHGGWLHLIANMWTLYIFGDNVEDALGRGKFLLLYLGSGVAGCFAQLLSNPSSPVPMVGASGAIAGVMGAYFSLFPGARVLTLIPVLFFVIIEVPAYIFLGLWFLLQFLSGTITLLGPKTQAGVAFWAHVGGFVGGFVLLRVLYPRRARGRGFFS